MAQNDQATPGTSAQTQSVAATDASEPPATSLTVGRGVLTELLLWKRSSFYVGPSFISVNLDASGKQEDLDVDGEISKKFSGIELGGIFVLGNGISLFSSADYTTTTQKQDLDFSRAGVKVSSKSESEGKLMSVTLGGALALADVWSLGAKLEYANETGKTKGVDEASASVFIPSVGFGFHSPSITADVEVAIPAKDDDKVTEKVDGEDETSSVEIDEPLTVNLRASALVTPTLQPGVGIEYKNLKKKDGDKRDPDVSDKLAYELFLGVQATPDIALVPKVSFEAQNHGATKAQAVGLSLDTRFATPVGEFVPRVALGKQELKSDSIKYEGTIWGISFLYRRSF